MGNKQLNITPINDICPISLDEIKDGIVLDCRHTYSIFYIQRYCLDYIIKNKNLNCPVCKKKIIKKKLKNCIFKDWTLVSNLYDNWNQKNIIYIGNTKKLYKKYKIIPTIDNYKIILPLFNTNNLTQSCLIKTPLLNKLRIVDRNIFPINFYKKRKTIYDEEINEIKICLETKLRYVGDYHKYYNVLIKILKKININFDSNKIIYDFLFKKKMYFFIDNQHNVTTYDNKIGTMDNNFFYKIDKCRILYSPYIIMVNSQFMLINKIHSIIYL